MNNYELTVVMPGKATPAKKKALIAVIEKMVKTFKGKISRMDDWGENELSYQIKGNDTGTFLLFILELDGKSAKTISQKLTLEDKLIRSLLIKTNG